jgi:hypothetical protein
MSVEIDPNDDTPLARICRVVNIVDALPEEFRRHRVDMNTPLRDVLPGAWPTYGDLVRLAEQHFPVLKSSD